MANSNCLEGVKCPDCSNEQSFQVIALATFTVFDDGTEVSGDVEYDAASAAYCTQCDWSGRWGQLGP